MNKKIKLITLLLTLIFCVSSVTFTAFATEGDGTSSVVTPVDPPVDDPVDPPVEDDPVDPPVEEPTDPPIEDDPVYDDPTEPEYEEPEYEEPTDVVTDDTDTDYDDSSNSSSNNDIYSNDSEEFYYEDDYYNNANSSGQTSTYSQNDMFDDAGKVDVNELSNDDWNAIAQNLANADKTDVGVDDFNFIKLNTSTEDNGIWMLITGAVLVILSVLGIGYVIISSVRSKKKLAFAGAPTSNNSSVKSSNRSSNDYGDGYSSRKPAPRKNRKLEDTADVYVPKTIRNGGSRFKD